MVLKRRLDYGFNGYQMPFVPRASRSARGKGSIRKKAEDNQIRAFELLATVATKLLQDRKSSALPNATNETDQHPVIKNAELEEKDIEKPIKLEPCDQKSCAVVPSPIGHHQNESDMTCFAEKLTIVGSRNAFERSSRKVVGDSYGYGDGISQRKPNTEPRKIRSMINGTAPDTSDRKDPMKLDVEPPALISSDNCVKASFFKDPNQSLFRYQGGIKVVSRDDDENSCRCSQRAFRQHIGDRRIRKLLAPIYRRVASNFKDRGLYYTDGKLKPIYRNWKSCYARQRYQKISPFRRRKLFDRNPLSKSNQGFSSKGICNFPEKGMICDNSGAGATSHARGASSSVAAQHVLPQSEDYNVKLSINSFIVPELLIELPATATIGSLKRTVMDAVTAILGDRLHVGILLQGQKVRDDNKTLLQTGISQDDKLHTLGFILEPQDAQIQLPLCTENRPFMLPDVSLQGLTPTPPETNLSNCVSRLDIIPPLPGMSTDETVTDSKALVAVPALAAVPFHHKPRCPQFAQRRTRRPFSISEVEALVHSVEKFGTGRWRDVKLRAFDNATHRTYVDLKDKWKTLVHTAKISPQQRRGEPVPQELLDRVLAAHAFWSRQRTEVFPSLLNNTDKAHVERWD